MRRFFIFFLLNLELKSIDFVLYTSSVYLAYYPQTNHIYCKNHHLTGSQFY